MKPWKRLIAVLIVLVMLGCVLPGMVVADVKSEPKITLEEAIGIVKGIVEIPEDYSNFKQGYNENERGVFWELNWSSKEANTGSLSATVNAKTGELWSLYSWQDTRGNERRGFPELSREEAGKRALAFLKKALLPEHVKGLLLDLEDDSSLPYISLREGMPSEYYFQFPRQLNGVPFWENSANIQVSADNGQINSFSFNWEEDLDFPEVKEPVSPEKATSLWRENAHVHLAYYCPQSWLKDEKVSKARLVFVPETRDLLIDAENGKILKPKKYYDEGLETGGAGELQKRMANKELTPAEQAALAELEKLISKEKALKIAKTLIGIPDGFEMESANLSEEYYSHQKIWNFHWCKKEEKKQSYINIGVEAEEGQIISYSNYAYEEEQKEPKINEAQATALASRFLEKVAKNYKNQIEEMRVYPVYGNPEPLDSDDKPLATGYNFAASRLVKNIPFPNNGITISVDAVSGEVASYRLNWWEAEFPEPLKTINKAQAENVFIGGEALSLSYTRDLPETVKNYDEKRSVKLVYSLDTRKAPVYVDAFQGQGLDYSFEPKYDLDEAIFTDLEGEPAAEKINLLAQAQIIPVWDNDFLPDARLSQRDFLIWLVRAAGWSQNPAATPEEEFKKVYREAFSMGILKSGDSYRPGDDLSRITLARLTVRALGWDEPAQLTGIWSLPQSVAKKLPAGEQGYLAMASGLGLFSLNDGFDPFAKMTRSEGALALYKLLE